MKLFATCRSKGEKILHPPLTQEGTPRTPLPNSRSEEEAQEQRRFRHQSPEEAPAIVCFGEKPRISPIRHVHPQKIEPATQRERRLQLEVLVLQNRRRCPVAHQADECRCKRTVVQPERQQETVAHHRNRAEERLLRARCEGRAPSTPERN